MATQLLNTWPPVSSVSYNLQHHSLINLVQTIKYILNIKNKTIRLGSADIILG